MKTFITLIILFVCALPLQAQKKYDIKNLYKIYDAEPDTKVITGFGNLEEATTILVPTKLDPGNYSVTVSRKGKDLYLVNGYNIMVETRYCYEYANSQKAALIIKSTYGFNKGELIFLK